MSQDKNSKENTNKDSKGKVKEEKKKVNFKSYFAKNKAKKILTISLIAIIGLGIGFYIGKDVGRSLPANHKYYSKSEVLATVDNVKITGEDFRKRMEPYFYYQGLKKLSDEEIESYEANTINYMTNLEALYKAGKEADFRKRMEPYFYYQGLKKLSDEEIESYEANTINYMTNLEALYKAGKEADIEITDEDLESNYTTMMSSITSYFNLTEEEFLKKFDLTSDYIKNSLEKEMIATEYLTENSEVTEKEAKNYYNKNKEDFFEIRASHILISNTDENGEDVSDEKKKENKELAEKILKRVQKGESIEDLALEYSDDLISNTDENGEDVSDEKKKENKELAEKILKRVQKGESIEDLALEYSDDTNTASNGGDLGFFSKGEMNENFEEASFSLKVGEVYSKVVETPYGYHIIKKTGEQYTNFDDVKESLIESLTSDKQSNLLQDALDKYNVKVNM